VTAAQSLIHSCAGAVSSPCGHPLTVRDPPAPGAALLRPLVLGNISQAIKTIGRSVAALLWPFRRTEAPAVLEICELPAFGLADWFQAEGNISLRPLRDQLIKTPAHGCRLIHRLVASCSAPKGLTAITCGRIHHEVHGRVIFKDDIPHCSSTFVVLFGPLCCRDVHHCSNKLEFARLISFSMRHNVDMLTEPSGITSDIQDQNPSICDGARRSVSRVPRLRDEFVGQQVPSSVFCRFVVLEDSMFL